jgi:hypothetical protein
MFKNFGLLQQLRECCDNEMQAIVNFQGQTKYGMLIKVQVCSLLIFLNVHAKKLTSAHLCCVTQLW